MNELPEWMQQEEKYIPISDHEGFITKSMLKLFNILERFKVSGRNGRLKMHAGLKLFGVIYSILLMALSRNMMHTYILLAVVIIYLCQMPGESLLRVLGSSLSAAGISAVLMIPAIFLGNPQSMVTIGLKVLVSVALVGIMTETTPWNRLTASLSAFHVPKIFIFTLDISLKYIVILGRVSTNILTALKLRSVGKHRNKKHSISGVLGITFIKSREMAEEMYQAMVCRGFDGEYRQAKKGKGGVTTGDVIVGCLLILETAVYWLLNH